MRVLGRQLAHRRAAHVDVEDAARACRSALVELVVRVAPPRGSGSGAARRRRRARTRPCPSRSRAPRTGGSAGSPPPAARAGSRPAPRRRSRTRGTYGAGCLPRGRTPPARRFARVWRQGAGTERIWWARPGKLCGLERPGGGGRSHRPERREAEIAYLKAKGVRLCVSTMASRHNLGAYEDAGLELAPRAGRVGPGAAPRRSRSSCRCCAASCAAAARWRCTATATRTSWPRSARRTCTRRAGWSRRRRWRARRRPASW